MAETTTLLSIGEFSSLARLSVRMLRHYLLTAQGLEPAGPCGVVEHDAEYTERDVDLSVFVTVPREAAVGAPLERVELAERDCLVARVVGPYTRITEAHTLIGRRLAEQGLTVADGDDTGARVFNIYLNSPEEVSEAELVTEVCVPLA